MEAARNEFNELMKFDFSNESIARFKENQERFVKIIEAYPQFAKETWGWGWYPLHQAAAFSSSLSLIKTVFDAYPKAAKSKTEEGFTPMHLACRYNQSEQVIQWLLEVYPEAAKLKTESGSTPLHIACANNQSEQVIRLLLEAYPEAAKMKHNYGWTPLDLARDKGASAEIINMLANPERVVREAKELEEQKRLAEELEEKKQVAEKFETRAALEREMQRLQQTIDEAKYSLETLRPLLDWPQYMPVAQLEQEISNLEVQVSALSIGPEWSRKAKKLSDLQAIRKRVFYNHFDNMGALAQQETRIVESNNIVTIFEKALDDMTDFLQLKYYFTAVNAQYRLGTITQEARKRLLYPSLEKVKDWCVSPFHVAMYRVALRYALAQKIISQFEYDQLDVAALECDMANSEFIRAMQTMIRQNSVRIDRAEESIQNLQENLMAVHENVKSLRQDMNQMATAINDTQVAFNDFKAALARKRKVEAGCSLVSSILNAVSLGAAGSALQGVVGFTVARIADFGDLAHLRGVFAGVSLPNELVEEIGDISIHDMLEHGVSLVEDRADDKLDGILKDENAIVVMAASATVLAETVEFEPTDESAAKPVAEPVAVPAAEPVASAPVSEPVVAPVAAAPPTEPVKPTKASPHQTVVEPVAAPIAESAPAPVAAAPPAEPATPTQGSTSDAPFAKSSLASSNDALEKKLAGLEKKRERLIGRAELAQKFGRDVDSIFEEIEKVDAEIDEVHDQIHSA